MKPALSVALAAVAALVVAASAPANHNGRPNLDHYVQADGSGQLIANPSGHDVTWRRCSPGAECEPQPADGNFLTVRDAPLGTAFEATQDGATSRSEPWRGVVRATAPPRVDGEVKVGGVVRPVAATWEGGWGRERDWLQMHACKTAEGGECKVIFDEIKFGQCRPGGGRSLPARYEGWWLRVADARIDKSQPFTSEGYYTPEGIKPNTADQAVAVATVGRIAPGRTPGDDCGGLPPDPEFGPYAAIARTIQPSRTGRMVAAIVNCPFECRAEVVLRRGKVTRRLSRVLAPGSSLATPGSGRTLALPRRLARRLGAGRVRVQVLVDGRRIASRAARLRLG